MANDTIPCDCGAPALYQRDDAVNVGSVESGGPYADVLPRATKFSDAEFMQ